MGLFETTEEELYQMAISRPLSEKIEKSLALIREFEPMALELSEEGYYVAFSGGKDSIVMARLFEMAGVKFQLWYNNVTIDPPELVQFIKKEYPHARWNNPRKHLLHHMVDNMQGLPTRLIRWCCEIYKEQGGKGLFKAIGVRSEESPRRKGLWTTIRPDRETGAPIVCPILYWTEKDIWTFIRQHQMAYCKLYDEGFTRLGCVGCPMGGKKGRSRDFARWPKYEAMWRRSAEQWLEKWRHIPRRDGKPRANTGYKTVDEYWSWWMEEEPPGDQPDCQLWLW